MANVDNHFEIILAMQNGAEQFLFSVRGDLIPQPQISYVHAGIGDSFANYLSERLYTPSLKLQIVDGQKDNLLDLAVFITKQVKDSVPGVGGDTSLVRWNKDYTENHFTRNEVLDMEREFSNFDSYLQQYWLDRSPKDET